MADNQKLAEYHRLQEHLTQGLLKAVEKGDKRAADQIRKEMEKLSEKYAKNP